MSWQDEWEGIPEDQWPIVNKQAKQEVTVLHRDTACQNRPGQKMLRVWVVDKDSNPLQGVKVRFAVEPSEGIAYDHPNVWGVTNKAGYVGWQHLGIATRYMLFMEDDKKPLIENVRTDLPNAYCRAAGRILGGWRPVNRPGVYSYRIEVRRKKK